MEQYASLRIYRGNGAGAAVTISVNIQYLNYSALCVKVPYRASTLLRNPALLGGVLLAPIEVMHTKHFRAAQPCLSTSDDVRHVPYLHSTHLCKLHSSTPFTPARSRAPPSSRLT